MIPDSRGGERQLGPEELRRYARQIVLPEVGEAGQERLKKARVLCVGAGGLGSPLAIYLAAAGIGRIGLIDFDRVDLSNIHRQILYSASDVGAPKVAAAAVRLRDINPHVEIDAHEERLTGANAMEIVARYDIVADGADNFATRYLVNDVCVLSGKPNVQASIFRFEGQISTFGARRGPCYRCLYPEPPAPGTVPACADAGVLGVLPGILGTLQALEVLKLILDRGETLTGRLLLVDALAMRFREISFRKDPACPVCGPNPTIRAPIDYEEFCGTRHGGADEEKEAGAGAISVEELAARLREGESIVLIDVREPFEQRIATIPGARLISLADLWTELPRLDRSAKHVVFCHTGVRSAHAVAMMKRGGIPRVLNLTGGIDAWSVRVDPSVPRY
ncbi:MAG: molybdopterin-synthase adenylyltransferase MoeB [Candidatus Eisenbacteria bacterium]|nr:molybdopterin-synthase adenylyltransferase MoeB [Candidatus Eisenbacteria bacterium]